MISGVVTDKDGNPVDGNGKSLNPSPYQPGPAVTKLFDRVQTDYQTGYNLQHRPFNEFDGYSLLDRARLDQESFAAFVGAEYVPAHKQWRWRGRKNTTRNRLIGILAQMLSAMLFPYVRAVNDKNEEEKDAARVMQILVEDHLKKAGYENKFLFMVVSALVNPAVFVGVEYVEAIQRIKQKGKDGKYTIIEAVDELLSGINLNIIPIDEILLGDFYTFDLQRQPFIMRVRRIAYDEARAIYGKNPDFEYVQAGKTRVVMTGQENQTLFDIDWTEADGNYVQEITAYYKGEDLQATFVAGVFMGNKEDIYNSNPFEHRRMILSKEDWLLAPVYPFSKSGFEPLDATGRFAYFKSAAFKAFWDDASINRAYQLLQDGMAMDVFKPTFISGVSKIDGTVLAPGMVVPIASKDARVEPYQLGPNLNAAMQVLDENKNDLAESTQDQTQGGVAEPNVTARATVIAERNAKIVLGVFGNFFGYLIEDIGGLVMDCLIQHETVGELDMSVPDALKMKYKTYLAEGMERGKEISNRIIFTDRFMGMDMTDDEKTKMEWDIFNKSGKTPEERLSSDQRVYEVNPYQFARMRYTLSVDADKIVQKSMGTDQERDMLAVQQFTNPVLMQYFNMENVARDFVVDQFADGDPDRYMAKQQPMANAMMGAVMGNNQPGQPGMGAPQQAGAVPGAQPAALPALSTA